MAFDPELHHRQSLRLQNYDYNQQGAYFITICTLQRQILFGEVAEGKAKLTEYGNIVIDCWNEIPKHFSDVDIDTFVVMPNHIHGIILITDNLKARTKPESLKRLGGRNSYLSQIVAYFKYQSTKHINAIRRTPGVPIWQRNYYEHIIRNEEGLNRAREYIINNPAQWEQDRENPDRIKK